MLEVLADGPASVPSGPGKWSIKEELGHCIDSAHNNLRRFIVARHEQLPHIVYQQDQWVILNDYNSWNILDLVDLWRLINTQIANVLTRTSEEEARCVCLTGSEHTVEWLAEDYVTHLKHHLHHLLSLEPVAYP